MIIGLLNSTFPQLKKKYPLTKQNTTKMKPNKNKEKAFPKTIIFSLKCLSPSFKHH